MRLWGGGGRWEGVREGGWGSALCSQRSVLPTSPHPLAFLPNAHEGKRELEGLRPPGRSAVTCHLISHLCSLGGCAQSGPPRAPWGGGFAQLPHHWILTVCSHGLPTWAGHHRLHQSFLSERVGSLADSMHPPWWGGLPQVRAVSAPPAQVPPP